MEILTATELENKAFEELLVYFDSIKKELLEFQLNYVGVDELLLTKDVITIVDLKDYFDLDHENRKYTFPMVNEYDSYKNKTFLGHQILPAKGFFWKFDVDIKYLSFGIVDVVFNVYKMGLATDMKHWSDKFVFKQEYPFYFDFELKQYVQVNRPTKKEMEEGVSSEGYLEYLNRKELHLHFEKRLEKENYVYQKNLEEASKVMGQGGWYTNTKIESVRSLFDRYLEFLETNKKYLGVKVHFNQIDQLHYERLSEHMENLKVRVVEGLLILEELEMEKHTEFMTTDLYYDPKWKPKTEIISGIRDSIVKFFRYRDRKDLYFKVDDGYFDYTDNRLFENPVLIEVENCKSIYSENRSSRQIEKSEILETMNKKKP